jgi:two-component system response regulator FimZ (fimbrial Z protein)
MISVCLADNLPAVHFGVKSYFREHPEINVVANVAEFPLILEALKNKKIDVLVVDLELKGLKNIFDLKSLISNNPKMKIIVYTSLNEQVYASNFIKAGVSVFLQKSSKLETLGITIVNLAHGLISNETRGFSNYRGGNEMYRKLSNREVEVLRFLSNGKKNSEISKILGLNEKTISTYKLRLLKKLNVSNLVDLVNKANNLVLV